MKCIIHIIEFICMVLFMPCITSAQPKYLDKSEGLSIKDYPRFKGVEYQIAVTEYIQDYFRDYTLSNKYNTSYMSTLAFVFDEKGSLVKVVVSKTTGSNLLDNKLLNLCKDFTRKKFMTPALSEDGPVPCVLEIPFEFNYSIMKDLSLSNEATTSFLGYRKLLHMGLGGLPRQYFHAGW